MKNPWKTLSKINPQRENGHREIANDVFQNLIKQKLNGSEWDVCMAIIDITYGFNKLSDTISYGQLAKKTDWSRRVVIRACRTLAFRRLIVVSRGTPVNEILFNKHYDTWQVVFRKTPGVPNDTGVPKDTKSGVPPNTHKRKERNREVSIKKIPLEVKNPDIKKFIDWWFEEWQRRFGEKYLVHGGKDGQTVKRLLAAYSFERLVELAGAFFDSDDEFIRGSGYTIGAFSSVISKLIAKPRASPLKAKYGEKGMATARNVKDWKPKEIPE